MAVKVGGKSPTLEPPEKDKRFTILSAIYGMTLQFPEKRGSK